VQAARETLRTLEKEIEERCKLGQMKSIEPIEDYLRKYPSGPCRKELQGRIAELRNDKQKTALEAEAARKASNLDTLEIYEAFMREWPSGKFAEVFRKRLGELRDIEKRQTEPGLNGFNGRWKSVWQRVSGCTVVSHTDYYTIKNGRIYGGRVIREDVN
jgi:hypothetical protein